MNSLKRSRRVAGLDPEPCKWEKRYKILLEMYTLEHNMAWEMEDLLRRTASKLSRHREGLCRGCQWEIIMTKSGRKSKKYGRCPKCQGLLHTHCECHHCIIGTWDKTEELFEEIKESGLSF